MTSAFPRFLTLPSITHRLTRDFQRLQTHREHREIQGKLTPEEEGILDAYEFCVKRAFEEAGLQAKVIYEDIGEVLGVGRDIVEGYFEHLNEENPAETADFTEKPMLIRLNLGDIIEKEVEEACKDYEVPIKHLEICSNLAISSIPPNAPIFPPSEPTKPLISPLPDSLSVSEASTEESKSGQFEAICPYSGLYQTLVEAQAGVMVSVLTTSSVDGERFPEKWEFLLYNEVKYPPYLGKSKANPCKCYFEQGCNGEYCTCAGQLWSNLTPNGLILPNKGYFQLQTCTSACHCSKSTCCLHLFTYNLRQSRTILACIAPKHWSLFAFDPIQPGEFVLEVTGEVRGEAEHVSKQGFFDPLLCLKPSLYLKTRAKGSLARFLTHSCEGNLSVLRVTPGVAWLETRLLLFSNRVISSKEELTVNFDQLLNLPFQIGCNCGAQTCRGQIGPL